MPLLLNILTSSQALELVRFWPQCYSLGLKMTPPLPFYCRPNYSIPCEKSSEIVFLLPSKDTLNLVLVPCYDLCSNAPFLFSRVDALEMDVYDFKMKDICYATAADPTVFRSVEMRSVDEMTKILTLEGGAPMTNPTAKTITHVLNNKQEFPFSRMDKI
ncbi:hypothetical protein V6N13_093233 [Hibiscus sabdariffa]|uniref:PNPLA domain-containing protein n=2 Tax=Hibiscus sabdariffa TaxID=183260 RepID=A0ABR2C9B8_9ROSI